MSQSDPRRDLPSVDILAAQLSDAPERLRLFCARSSLHHIRQELSASTEVTRTVRERAQELLDTLQTEVVPSVINATGTVLHTGLGRAPLSKKAQAAATRVLNGYCQLEFDLINGSRGNRQNHVAPLLCALTGAESALVVNNCAAATVLMLQALAQQREVIVSRGELVEIGGSFRVPEIMQSAGCHLVEVGATNKTHVRDYSSAITENTGLLLKVHQSNFEQRGFVAEVSSKELAGIAKACGIPFAVDQGSGCIVDLSMHNYQCPQVTQELQAGVDIVACSGDKLLGGPQAGILLGRADLIARCARHPLARALRCDKVTIAALAATIQEYLFEQPCEKIPTLRMLSATREAVRQRAEKIIAGIDDHIKCTLIETQGAVGSGALPTDGPPSIAIVPHVEDPERAHRQLRTGTSAVVARIHNNQLLIDCACVDDSEIDALIQRINELRSE